MEGGSIVERKKYHHENLKLELIEKGIEIVNMVGISDFSIRKVSTACGVSHTAPYAHFENKEALLEKMQEYIVEKFSAYLESVIIDCDDETKIMKQLGIAYVRFFLHNPTYYSFLFTQSNLQIDLTMESEEDKNFKPFEVYKNVMIRFMEKINYPITKRKDMIISLWAYVHGIAALATMSNVRYNENWEEKISDFIDIFKIE